MRTNKILSILTALLISSQCTFANDVWHNDLRELFTKNSAVIYEINIRTFGAQDTNQDGIIDFDNGENSGSFINAIPKLDDLKRKGINTIHVLPITPVGKIKALGTAGSLYAASSFNTINPQLADKESNLSLKAQAKQFIDAAHSKNIRVIFDLPSCGSYDLYMERPELFVKDKSNQPVIPADWTDVRLLNAGSETNINQDVYNLYKDFVDMALELEVDGIRADVAPLKPAKFWKELISYSRSKNPQFMWLAEVYEYQSPISEYAVSTSKDELLKAGFDGYYGAFSNIKDFKTGKEVTDLIQNSRMNVKKYSEPKSVILSFVTHDEMSPLLVNGQKLSEMIMWLNATLPFNSYFTDGFDTGDNYIYQWANKQAPKTFTDDDIYFAHRGKLDIFNFSRQPKGSDSYLYDNFILSNKFKHQMSSVIQNGKFNVLKSQGIPVFAYSLSYKNSSIIVIGNMDFKTGIQTFVSVPKLTTDNMIIPIKIDSIPSVKKGGLSVNLKAGETIVLFINDLQIK